jgi:hypothetical protein
MVYFVEGVVANNITFVMLHHTYQITNNILAQLLTLLLIIGFYA